MLVRSFLVLSVLFVKLQNTVFYGTVGDEVLHLPFGVQGASFITWAYRLSFRPTLNALLFAHHTNYIIRP
jgi:hypothetical protein